MTRGVLHVIPHAGLCNRLRAVLCGIGAAEATDRQLVVTWRPGVAFDATMADLWSAHPSEWLPVVGDIVTIETGSTFAEELQPRPWVENYRTHFDLRWSLRKRISRVRTHMRGGPVLGVAVRTHLHAHDKTKLHSPPEWYEQRLEEILCEHPGVGVFVSSDVPALVDRWRERWPQIITLPHKGAYGSIRGCQDALCDLHILASCDYLIGAHWSSLSTTAGLLQGTGAFETSISPASMPIGVALGAVA